VLKGALQVEAYELFSTITFTHSYKSDLRLVKLSELRDIEQAVVAAFEEDEVRHLLVDLAQKAQELLKQ
jgi:hypothetical protein